MFVLRRIRLILLLALMIAALLVEHVCTSSAFEPLQILIEVNGYKVPAIVDTGAEISVMSTSCAERCRLTGLIDTQHAGKAIGVGTSEIVGGIDGLGLRIGPLSFQNKVSILRTAHHRCDFIIGLDILKRFNCDILLRQKLLKLNVKGNEIRVPLLSFESKIEFPIEELCEKDSVVDLRRPVPANTDIRQKKLVQPRGGYYQRQPQQSLKRGSSFYDTTEDNSGEESNDQFQRNNDNFFGADQDDEDEIHYDTSISMEGV